MADKSRIEWTEATWNPTTGCDRISKGCDNCYALTMAKRLQAMGSPKYQSDGDPRTSGPGFGLTLHPPALAIPMGWRKPRRVFVDSMSDLFHAKVPASFVRQVFDVMAATPHHTYQVLTKRSLRLARLAPDLPWPPNVWMGVSVEDASQLGRVDHLRSVPAAVRFLSAEPLLRSLAGLDLTGIGWVIAGGESGRDARPMHPDWARSLRDQCTSAGVPFFFKQWGAWEPIGPLYGDDDETDDAHMEAVTIEVIERREVVQLESYGYIADGYQPGDPRTWLMARTGKGAAGRLLDGRTWDQYPDVDGA